MHRRAVLDEAVHGGLGKVGLVPLVVAVAAVADDFNHHVGAEGLPVVQGQPRHMSRRLRVLAVDVKNRGRHHFGHVGGVEGRAGIGRKRGKTNLVVDDDVNGAAGPVPLQLGKVEGLGHHPLAREGGIAMNQNREHPLVASSSGGILAGTTLPLHHRVHGLQVGGIEGQGEVDGAAGCHLPVTGEPLVVLNVAIPDDADVVGKLRKDVLQGLAEDVRQDIEPPPVGHPQDEIGDAMLRGPRHHHIQKRDEGLAPLQGKALLPQELAVEEFLEEGRLLEGAENVELLFPGE